MSRLAERLRRALLHHHRFILVIFVILPCSTTNPCNEFESESIRPLVVQNVKGEIWKTWSCASRMIVNQMTCILHRLLSTFVCPLTNSLLVCIYVAVLNQSWFLLPNATTLMTFVHVPPNIHNPSKMTRTHLSPLYTKIRNSRKQKRIAAIVRRNAIVLPPSLDLSKQINARNTPSAAAAAPSIHPESGTERSAHPPNPHQSSQPTAGPCDEFQSRR
jgi:hypothetical protein